MQPGKSRQGGRSNRILVENINDVIYSLDTEGRITYIRPAIEKDSQFSTDELIGQPFFRFVHPQDLPGVLERFQEAKEGRLTPFEFRVVTKDGKGKYVQTSSRPVYQSGHLTGITGVLADITERKLAEQQVEEFSRFLETLMNTLPVPIFYKDVSGKYLGCNSKFEEYIGIAGKDLIGKTAYDITSKDLARPVHCGPTARSLTTRSPSGPRHRSGLPTVHAMM